MAPGNRSNGELGGDGPPEWLTTVGRDTRALLSAVENLSTDLSVTLRDGVDHRPVASLGVAFLAGYILGGGLTLRLGTFAMAGAVRALFMSALATAARNLVADERQAGVT